MLFVEICRVFSIMNRVLDKRQRSVKGDKMGPLNKMVTAWFLGFIPNAPHFLFIICNSEMIHGCDWLLEADMKLHAHSPVWSWYFSRSPCGMPAGSCVFSQLVRAVACCGHRACVWSWCGSAAQNHFHLNISVVLAANRRCYPLYWS